MARKLDPGKMAYAAELYASGETFQQVAAKLGMHPESLRIALKRRGIKARPNWHRSDAASPPKAPDGLVDAYLTGESELALSRQHGVSRNVVTRWLREAGIERRSRSAAGLVRASQMTPEARAAQAAAAQGAVRGKPRSEIAAQRTAIARERVGYGGRTSPGADYLAACLTQHGVTFTREKAVGRYNVDIAITAHSIAVEILGGGWHGYKPIHAKRTPYILNEGWSILFVWNQRLIPLGAGALDYLLSYIELAGENPSRPSEYRVIRGDGQIVAAGGPNDDNFPLVPPSQSKLG